MTGIIILAAGESSRLGRPKQLVPWNGKSLLRHAVETAIASGLGPVAVVLGAVDQPCRECLKGLEITITHNPDWSDGMGGSIASGMRALAPLPLEGVIVMLCDQPLVTHHLLRALAEKSAGHPIVTAHYQGHPGPPAWFSNTYFGRLGSLEGKSGAKALIRGEPHRLQISAPEAAFDIDLPEDLAVLGSADQLANR